MKSIHYLATTVKVYREAIDRYYRSPTGYRVRPRWRQELAGLNQRGYCTGFYLGIPEEITPAYDRPIPSQPHIFAGKVLNLVGAGAIQVDVRNKIEQADIIEILSPKGLPTRNRVIALLDESGNSIDCAQPGSRVTLRVQQQEISAPALIRKVIAGDLAEANKNAI